MSFNVTRLLFVETGAYHTPTARPYTSNMTNMNVINTLQEATLGGSNITAASVASTAGKLLIPSVEAGRDIIISNNWTTRRFRYIMEIESTTMGVPIKKILMGYSDNADVTLQNTLNPNMRMFINTVLVLRAVNGQWQMAENNHLLANDLAIHGMGTALYSNAVTLRPQDIFSTLLFENQYGGDGSAMYDFRPSLANGVTKSSRGNSIHGNYLAKSLNAIHGAQTSSDYQTSTTGSIYSEALSRVKENNIADDPLLQRMDDETGLFEEGYFTYGWLCQYSPSVNAHGVTRSILLDQPTRINTDHVHQSNNFKGSTVESVMATILTNTVPTTLMECFLTKIHFVTTNMTMDNSVSVQLVDLPQGFVDGGLVEKFANMFIDKLIHIIMPDVTNNFQHLVNIDMSVDVLGDTKINISINGGTPEPFVVPSFADGLMAPIIGNDTSDVRNLALDITTLAGNLEHVATNAVTALTTSSGYNW